MSQKVEKVQKKPKYNSIFSQFRSKGGRDHQINFSFWALSLKGFLAPKGPNPNPTGRGGPNAGPVGFWLKGLKHNSPDLWLFHTHAYLQYFFLNTYLLLVHESVQTDVLITKVESVQLGKS